MDSSFVVMPATVLQSLCDTALFGILQMRAAEDNRFLDSFRERSEFAGYSNHELISSLTQASNVEGARFVVRHGQSFPSQACDLLAKRIQSIRCLCGLAWDGEVRVHREDAQALADCGVALSLSKPKQPQKKTNVLQIKNNDSPEF
jgi:hypothetical protein